MGGKRNEPERKRPAGFDDRDEVTFPGSTPALLLLTPWTMDRALHVMRRSDGEVFTSDSRMSDDQRQALVDAVNAGANIEALRSDAFDFGYRAAGGTMIPDGARDMVELAIDRLVLSELLDFAEAGENAGGGPFSEALAQFIENVSIYRSRK